MKKEREKDRKGRMQKKKNWAKKLIWDELSKVMQCNTNTHFIQINVRHACGLPRDTKIRHTPTPRGIEKWERETDGCIVYSFPSSDLFLQMTMTNGDGWIRSAFMAIKDESRVSALRVADDAIDVPSGEPCWQRSSLKNPSICA